MGRAPCCDKTKVKRGPWSPEEDNILKNYIHQYGTGGNWILFPQKAGLKRCGKSCRLRWLNYLRPNIKHGGFTEDEDNIILTLYHNIGSRWSIIASHLPERTDNDVKNHWNTKLKKKLLSLSATPTNTNHFNFARPSSNVSVHNNNMLPYFPMDVINSDMRPQISLPDLIEIPKNEENSAFSFGRFSYQDNVKPSLISLDNNANANANASASTSWSTDTWSYDAFGFQENFTDEMNNSDFNYSSALSNLLGNESNTEQSFSQSLTY